MAVMLSGCSGLSRRDAVDSLPGTSKTLTATGYSRFEDAGRLSVNHRWLSAQQLAKLNAYRGLADQLYYEPVGENQTVGSQVIGHEVYRVYLDTYLREARASDYRTVKDSLKTTLDLKLTPRFYQCMGGDVAQARQCIREDGKVAFTRLGYKTAATTSANLACGVADCSDQFYVSGFSNDRNPVDAVLLDHGFYDLEWTINTGARIFFNTLLINGFIDAI
ncbi:hypothetical protein [Methylomonas sp. LL1]|uniref:hypothetical protein n=1 Tax=Methylomonas sp. LL1 TaxID=2785785 RepID=UPI001E4F1E08|nr:hypothetical protein [Methylomonas sp. LL1]